jgi:Carboxypeptidase regulatory-like domain
MRGLALLVVVALLAGCSEAPAPAPAGPVGPIVEGWVVDATRTPIVGARVFVQGQNLTGTTDDEGHYAFQAPPALDLLVIVQAEGFHSSSQLATAFSGTRHVLNFSLERIPVAEPYQISSEFEGSLTCAFTVVLQEDPERPHEHTGVSCNSVTPVQTNVWNYTIPANTTGLVLEGFWEPQTPFSEALVIKAEVPDTGQVLAFLESSGPLRVQLSAANIAEAGKDGRTILRVTVTPGAGTGSHEHGAIGLFLEQEFQLVMTAFFNGPVDPAFSISR